MKWSFSAARAFRQCQRAWFFKNCLASAKSNDAARQTAYFLSKLQSVSSWRGKLVDGVLSDVLVPGLRRHRPPTKAALRRAARERFERERDLALRERDRLTIKTGDVVLRAIEYGEDVTDIELAQAWHDVETAIDNLFTLDRIRYALKNASYVIAQRSLQFQLDGVLVVAVPDVIAFNEDAAPVIVDWKVHGFGARDYRLQLALYAMALSRCKPHKDFPASATRHEPTEFHVFEAQLLAGIEHEYSFTSTDFDDLEDYIGASATEMIAATAGLKNGALRAADFAVTEWPNLCERCGFKRICWKDDDGARDQHLFDYQSDRAVGTL